MEIYKGRGNKSDETQLIKVIDEVFFGDDTSEHKQNFMNLLPKLYKEKYNPGYNNLIVKEGEDIKAAIGCYPMDAVVSGKPLRVFGIGNVAVTKDSRGKGYMKDLMEMAVEIMKADDYDYAILGGQRQRYGYFGFESAGNCLQFSFNKSNIKHLAGKDAKSTLTARELTEADTDIIKQIKAINEASAAYTVRSEDATIDILKSWRGTVYGAFEGEEFKGYFCAEKYHGSLHELRAKDRKDLLNLIMCAIETTGKESLNLRAPLYDTEVCNYFAENGEWTIADTCDRISILNFAKFIEAYFPIKAQRLNLCPGTLNLLIHGIKRDEQLTIKVNGKNVTVAPTDAKPDLELSHLEAVRFIAGIYSKERLSLPAFAQNWFPLDFFAYSVDNV